jgi:hypothetical protein
MVIYTDSPQSVKTAFNQSLQVFASALQLWLQSYEPLIHAGMSPKCNFNIERTNCIISAEAAASASDNSASMGTFPSFIMAGFAGVLTLLFIL